MNRKSIKKYKWLEMAILVWTLVGVLAMTVLAAETSTYSYFKLEATSGGKLEITPTSTGWNIKAYGTDGSCGATNTETVTFTISNTDTDRAVTFDISVTSSDASPSGAPSGSLTLAAGGSLNNFTATSGKGSNSFTTINISITNIVQESLGVSVTTTIKPSTGGTIKVDGTEVTAQKDFTKLDSETYTLTATADSGYTFYGWMSTDGALTTDGAASYTYAGKKATTLWPLFIKSDSAMYYIKDASPLMYYGYLDEAITAVGNSGTIVMYKSGVAYHSNNKNSFTIPSGVTLLLPYSADDTSIKDGLTSGADYLANGNYTFVGNTGGQQAPNSSVTYTLTIPSTVTLKVADGTAATVGNCGRIVVGGTIASGNGSTVHNGATYGAHSNLVLDGTLDLGNYAVLATTGYVLGSGHIYAEGVGAQIFQPYVVEDFPGAAVAAMSIREGSGGSTQPSGESKVAPYIYWGVVNIQTKLTMNSGNFMYAYATLGDDGTGYHTNAALVGNSSVPALLVLDSDATFSNEFKTIKWSGYSYGLLGRNQIRVEGGASMGSLKLEINVGAVDTATVVASIGYNMDVTLANGHDYFVNKSTMLLPGASLTVADSATLTIGDSSEIRFAVWDGLIHRGYRYTGNDAYEVAAAATRNKNTNYPTNVELDKGGLSEDAELVINGKLVIGANAAFGGIIQTSEGGTVEVDPSATTSVQVQANILDRQYVNLQRRVMASMSMFDSTAKLNMNGQLRDVKAGVTFIGTPNTDLTNAGFTNIYYPGYDSSGNRVAASDLAITYNSAETIKGTWLCQTHTDADNNYICDVCGATTHTHTYTSTVTEPTCTTDGYTTYLCSCGDTYTGNPVAALGHTEVTDKAVAATCTDTGLTEGSHCETCGEVLEAQKVIPALGHTETELPAVAATCTSTGLTAGVKCSVCGEIITAQETVPALGHTEVIDEAVAATCKAPGKTQGSHCSVCNTVLVAQTEVEKLPHTEEIIPAVAATCTTPGWTEGKKCSVCGEILTASTETEKAAHTEVIDAAVDATCTTDGKTEGSHCSVCGETIVAQETISATGHSPETIPGYAATCVKDGLTDGTKCSVCGEEITAQETIPATGIHTWANGVCTVCGASSAELCPHENYGKIQVDVIAPTCTAQGYTIYQCENCGGTYNSDYVENTGHTPGQAATCTTAQVCTVCSTELAPATGHNYSAVVTAPTCTDAGYTTYTCSKCDDSYTIPGDTALGHTEDEPVTEKETGNTCIGISYDHVIYCTVCSAEISRETITSPAQGHKYTDEVTPPTCIEQGFTTHTCSVCGEVVKDSYTAASGHSYGDWSVTTPATYNTPAVESSTCHCGEAQTRNIPSALVNEQEILTLSEALAAVAEGGTVTLLTDIEGEITVSQVVTIEKGTFTANISAGKGYTYQENGTTVIIGKASLTIYATNIKAGDSLDLYFYVKKDDLSGTDYKAVINRTKAGAATTPVEIPYAEWTDYGIYKRFCYDGIAAKEMTDEVTVTICDTSGNPLSSATTETIQGYALRVLSRTTDAELQTALVDMLNYGAAAQQHFDNYNGNDLATANAESYQVYATKEEASCTEESKDDNVNLKSASVTVKSNLYYTFYFTGIDTSMSATATYTDHYGNPKTVSVPGNEFHVHTTSDGSTLWGVDVKGLAIADGRQIITCEVLDGTAVAARGVGSVQGYVASAKAQGEESAVYGMLMKFVDSAYAYFH